MFSLTPLRAASACLFLVVAQASFAQQLPAPPKEQTSNISGRVTAGGKGVAGVAVSVASADGRQRRNLPHATTDADGRYFLTNVTPGLNMMMLNAPVYVSAQEQRFGDFGKSITVYPGETIEDVDFTLRRGAVITGRITDAEGEPIAFGQINITRLDQNNQKERFQPRQNWEMLQTDDRGIYRVYGLAPGRYKVSFGAAKEEGGMMFTPRGYYQRVFYPNTTDENEAQVLELAEGDEAADIDIKLGRREMTFQVTGRVVDAATGQPVPHMSVGVSPVVDNARGFGGVSFGQPADAGGEFSIPRLVPNRYQLFVENRGDENNDFYGEPVPLEIVDRDVANVEVKVRRGASISGVVVLDGNAAQTSSGTLGPLTLMSHSAVASATAPPWRNQRWARIGADRQFRIAGLQPGKLKIMVYGGHNGRSVSVLRIERNGVDVQEGIEVGANEQISDLRIVVAQGSGVINVQVKADQDALPEGTRMFVNARRAGARQDAQSYGGEVDVKGRATINGLVAGDYEVMLNVMTQTDPARGVMRGERGGPPQTQTVTINEGARTDVTFTYTAPAARETQAP